MLCLTEIQFTQIQIQKAECGNTEHNLQVRSRFQSNIFIIGNPKEERKDESGKIHVLDEVIA